MKSWRSPIKVGESTEVHWAAYPPAGRVIRVKADEFRVEPYAARCPWNYRPRFKTWAEAFDFLRFFVEQRDGRADRGE